MTRSRTSPVRIAVVALIAIGAALPAAGALAAAPKTVAVPASVVYRTGQFPTPNDPQRCIAVSFAQYGTVGGAKSYSVLARGFKGSSNVTGGGPPFTQDTFKLTSGKKVIALKVPGGHHWFALGTSSTGQGCQASLAGLKGRFAIVRATATT